MGRWRIALALVGLVVILVATPSSVFAIDVNVTTTNDEITTNGLCSLREAIQSAGSGFVATPHPDCGPVNINDRIVLPAGTFRLTIPGFGEDGNATGDLDVRRGIRIVGAGPAATSIRAGDGVLLPVDRAFHVIRGASLALEGVDIRFTNSFGTGGGGAILAEGPLTLTDVTISFASSNEAGGAILSTDSLTMTRTRISQSISNRDGAINASGTVVIRDSEITNNEGKLAGAIEITGQTTTSLIERTTISNNKATGNVQTGDIGIAAIRYPNQSGHQITNSTISSNLSTSTLNTPTPAIQTTGGLVIVNSTIAFNQSILSSALRGGTIDVSGSIITNNFSTGNTTVNCQGNIRSGGFNMFQAGCIPVSLTQPTDQVGFDPQLGALQFAGGFAPTHPIAATSLAVDRIPATIRRFGSTLTGVRCVTDVNVDERGFARPQGLGINGKCDVGAFELQTPGTGVAVLEPTAGSVAPGERTSLLFAWVVPQPKNWHDLRTLELRFRDAQGIALWVRWDEASQAFQLVNPDGTTTPAYVGGSNQALATPFATLYLAGSSTVGSGPTGPSVVLDIQVSFASSTLGRTFTVESLAVEDSNAQQGFDALGTLAIVNGASAPANPNDPNEDKPRKLTEDQRRQKEHTNQSGSDDERTEGDVIAVRCDGPYAEVDIVNRDGQVTVRLIHDAKQECASIGVGDYLEADGEKENESLFYGHAVEYHRPHR